MFLPFSRLICKFSGDSPRYKVALAPSAPRQSVPCHHETGVDETPETKAAGLDRLTRHTHEQRAAGISSWRRVAYSSSVALYIVPGNLPIRSFFISVPSSSMYASNGSLCLYVYMFANLNAVPSDVFPSTPRLTFLIGSLDLHRQQYTLPSSLSRMFSHIISSLLRPKSRTTIEITPIATNTPEMILDSFMAEL